MCERGHFCPEGSTSPTAELCPAGRFNPNEGMTFDDGLRLVDASILSGYDPDRNDRFARDMSRGMHPVAHTDNTGEAFYQGHWVAEATVAYNDGSTIRQFQNKQSTVRSLRQARALAKQCKKA